MLVKNDIEWLRAEHPSLRVRKDLKQVSGKVRFVGSYDKDKDLYYTPIEFSKEVTLPGIVLSGEYEITIEENKAQRLPKFYIHDDNIRHTADRHFYNDESACVCGIIEELKHLEIGLSFRKYFEELALPFLYGQKYYDEYRKWPWKEYAHNLTGALESYYT